MEKQEWNRELLIPLWKASGIKDLEYFQQIIRLFARDLNIKLPRTHVS